MSGTAMNRISQQLRRENGTTHYETPTMTDMVTVKSINGGAAGLRTVLFPLICSPVHHTIHTTHLQHIKVYLHESCFFLSLIRLLRACLSKL